MYLYVCILFFASLRPFVSICIILCILYNTHNIANATIMLLSRVGYYYIRRTKISISKRKYYIITLKSCIQFI